MSVTVRLATPSDATAAADLLQDSIREVCGPDYCNDHGLLDAWCANKTPETLRSWIVAPDLYTLVAEREDGPVGVGQLAVDRGEITLCYVLPAALGQGVGAALLRALEAEASCRGLYDLTLTSTATAHEFYRKHGYNDAGTGQPFGLGRMFPMAKQVGMRTGADT